MIPSNLFGPRSHLFREVEVRERQCEGFGGPGRCRRRRCRASSDRQGEGEDDGAGIVCAFPVSVQVLDQKKVGVKNDYHTHIPLNSYRLAKGPL